MIAEAIMVGSSRDVYGEIYLNPKEVTISEDAQAELDAWEREEARRQEEYNE
jgi:hypothetical protein